MRLIQHAASLILCLATGYFFITLFPINNRYAVTAVPIANEGYTLTAAKGNGATIVNRLSDTNNEDAIARFEARSIRLSLDNTDLNTSVDLIIDMLTTDLLPSGMDYSNVVALPHYLSQLSNESSRLRELDGYTVVSERPWPGGSQFTVSWRVRDRPLQAKSFIAIMAICALYVGAFEFVGFVVQAVKRPQQ